MRNHGIMAFHARDRMWQMDLNRRIGAGRLSVPGTAKPGEHRVTSSCNPSGDVVRASSTFLVTDGIAKANDGTLDSNAATVNLTVTPVNDAPVADDDSARMRTLMRERKTLARSQRAWITPSAPSDLMVSMPVRLSISVALRCAAAR